MKRKRRRKRNYICEIITFAMIAASCASMIALVNRQVKAEEMPPLAVVGNERTVEKTEIVPSLPSTEAEKPEEIEMPEAINLGEYKLTAYCSCKKCCGKWATIRPTDKNGNQIVYTASGTIAEAGRTIAVDPSVIPYGSAVEINGHLYIAEDCGGAIKGNRIDVYFDDHNEALAFGVQYAEIFLLISVPFC